MIPYLHTILSKRNSYKCVCMCLEFFSVSVFSVFGREIGYTVFLVSVQSFSRSNLLPVTKK